MIDTWTDAHDTGDRGKRLSDDEKDEIWEWMKTKQSPLTLAEAKRQRANGGGR